MIDADSAGHLYKKSQVIDYCFRGEGLEEYNMHEFIKDTYEMDILRANSTGNEQVRTRGGRPHSNQVHYLEDHPKSHNKC